MEKYAQKAQLSKGACMKFPRLSTNGLILGFCIAWVSTSLVVHAHGLDMPSYEVMGVKTPADIIESKNQSFFYKQAKERWEFVEREAYNAYLDAYWTKEAKSKNQPVEKFREEYLKQHIKISDKEIKSTLDRFKDHPQLSKLSKAEQESQVKEYLRDRDTKALYQSLIDAGLKKKELVIYGSEPQAPMHNIVLSDKDHMRYGPLPTDTKPIQCVGEKCPIIVYEYSDFECPFCSGLLEEAEKALTEYKGKILWVTRDFPLSFHNRAKPAAIAAKCASSQGKYWEMYMELFRNQRNLADADLEKYAQKIGVNMTEFQACQKNPTEAEKRIAENMQTASQNEVTGTPTVFINGRPYPGAVKFNDLKKVMDAALEVKKTK
jgi:protein-disulfide isomerase